MTEPVEVTESHTAYVTAAAWIADNVDLYTALTFRDEAIEWEGAEAWDGACDQLADYGERKGEIVGRPGQDPRAYYDRLRSHRLRATIVHPGRPGYHYGEPQAELADGRVMPLGWNLGKTYPVGTRGVAEYVSSPSAGLWQFTPVEEADA